MKMQRRTPYCWIIICCSLLIANPAFADIPRGAISPGKVGMVPLKDKSDIKPTVKFGSRDVLVVAETPSNDNIDSDNASAEEATTKWIAVVGVSNEILPGNYILQSSHSQSAQSFIEFEVVANPPRPDYANIELDPGFAHLDFDNPSMGISAEIVRKSNLSVIPNFDFNLSVESIYILDYGPYTKDGNILSHPFITYICRSSAHAYAPAEGKIIAIEPSELNGHSVYLDHGSGVISIIGNLQNILVGVGQVLDGGEQIGTSKKTPNGQISRIDWAMVVNGYLVDPLQFSTSS